MHPASGPSDYRAPQKGEGVMTQVADTAGRLSETARDLGKHALDLAGDLGAAIKERPYTTIGIATDWRSPSVRSGWRDGSAPNPG